MTTRSLGPSSVSTDGSRGPGRVVKPGHCADPVCRNGRVGLRVCRPCECHFPDRAKMHRRFGIIVSAAIAILVAGAWTAALTVFAGAGEAASVHPLPFFYDLYTFRGPGAETSVVAAFAVPAGRLEREGVGDEVRYRFDVTLVLADTARRSVSRADDSVFVSFPRALGGGHLLYTFVEVQTPPSVSTVQRVIMTDATTPGVGQLYDSYFPIPDYSGTHLMVSDIALGLPGAEDGWRRGDVELGLLPSGQFPTSSFEVYYEIYNLAAGTSYTTEVFVERVDDDGIVIPSEDPPVRLRFTGESGAGSDGVLPELRRVETALERGRYRITVRITDDITMDSASRSRLFEVEGWERGATLVRAMPRWPHGPDGGH